MKKTCWPLLAAVATITVGPRARAELWVSPLGELLQRAQRIEIVHVTEVKSAGALGVAQAVGKVTRSVRGTAVGKDVTIPILYEVAGTVAKGVDLVVICDPDQCPRAEGIDRGGWALLEADEPGDGAWIFPGLVELSSLDALAAGTAAPDLCVRGHVVLLDTPATPFTFTATIGSAKGGGTTKGFSGKTQPKASLRLEHTGLGYPAASIDVGDAGSQTFVGGPITRAADGCFDVDLVSGRPFARSVAAIDRHLAGKTGDVTIAKGTIHVTAGDFVKHKDFPVAVMADQYGNVRLDSPLFSAKHATIESTSNGNGDERLGFPLRADFEPELVIDLGAAILPAPGADAVATVATAIAGPRKVSWTVLVEDAQHVPAETTIGTIELSYVPEKP